MNRLEVLGWSVLAREVLTISAWEARMLAHLVAAAPGRVATYEFLSSLVVSPHFDAAGAIAGRVVTKVSHLRRALMDLGFSGSSIENVSGVGYRVEPDVASLIVTALQQPDAWRMAA